jgi:alpha-L-rhamnosidase
VIRAWLVVAAALVAVGVAVGRAGAAGVPGPAPARGHGHVGPSARALRCEYLVDPLGIDERSPRLSWTFGSPERGDVQTAYRVLVASSPEVLAREEGDLWDTGVVKSDRMSQIAYAGAALASRERCFWRVMLWNGAGEAGAWSEPACWEMGLLEPADWTAKWLEASGTAPELVVSRATYSTLDGAVSKDVTDLVRAKVERGEPVAARNEALGGDPARDKPKRLRVEYSYHGAALTAEVAEGSSAVLPTERVAYLRTSFNASKPVARARLYATALGVYELSLNGDRVGDQRLAPGWTDYGKRVQYQTYDVTGRVRAGENVLGGVVAPGWFCGRAGLFHANKYYGKEPALLAQLEITYADGSVERVVTDHAWRRHDAPILMADLMDGEACDARDELAGWDAPGTSIPAGGWSAGTERAESRTLVAQPDEPVRVLREIPAKSLTEPAPRRWTFDLGENVVGVVRLHVRAAAGTVVTLRHAEMLNPDGTVYTENLRGAAATDVYVCAGGGDETWTPRFTFHGFRYVEVTGLAEKPGLGAVTGVVLGSDVPADGEFSCSDPRLNRLQANIVRGLHGNYLSVPTDCPQRDERMGWMADAQVFVPTAVYNADVAPFMTKWLRDVLDAQREDGAYPDTAPVMRGLSYGTPAWADAGTLVVWAVYRAYGDTRVLERNIDGMRRWVDWCREHSTGLIRDRDRGNDYGDWLSIGAETPKELIGTAYFARSAQIVAESLGVLGRESEAEKYRELAAEVRGAFIAKYLDGQGRVMGNTQCGDLLALRFGLVPEELRGAVVRHLVADIEAKGWHLSTGFVGVGQLLPALTDAGRPDLAYRLLVQDTFPSWLFSVRHGATTIWERWDGWTPERGVHPDASMNSFNHYSLGSCGQWLFEGVAGIEPDPGRAGFEHFFVRPRTEGPLAEASGAYRSIRGEIRSRWRIDNDRLNLSVTIPGNTGATVVMPARENTPVLEGGEALAGSPGIRSVKREGDRAVIEVGGGNYEFTSTRPVMRSGNPVASGWYADPDAAALGGEYWICPTTSDTYDRQLAFDAFSSPDLVRWTKHADVLKAGAVAWVKRAMWAPCIVEREGKCFLFFAANDIQKDGDVGGIGVAVADGPAGPFTDHLGKPLVGEFHNGAQPIDPCVFQDDDGRSYLIYGGWGHCNIAKLAADFRSLEPLEDGTTFREITPEGYVEGPYMFKRGSTYYFMWSEGGWTGPDYSVAYATSESPTGPFRRVGKVLTQDPKVATGAGHHSVVRVPGEDEWYIVYHRRPLGETDPNHRVVCIDRLTFDAQGHIQPVRLTVEGVSAPGSDAER